MAVASVTTNIVIKGQDDASAAINKASKSAKGLTGALEGVQAKAQGLTGSLRSMVSGDVLGGVKGLGGSLGGGSGLAGQAALAAAGIAGIGVALGAAAIKITEWSIELERLRAQMRFAFAGGEQEAFAFADAVGGVGVESVVKLSTTLKSAGVDGKVTTEQLQAIANAATAMGKTGDDALSAFADAVRSGSTEALKQVGVFVNSEVAIKQYAKQMGILPERMTAAQRSQAVLNATLAAVPGLAQAGTDAHARQDAALSRLGNAWTAYKLELSEIVAGPAVDIVESVNKISDAVGDMTKGVKLAVKLAFAPVTAIIGAINAAFKSLASLATGAGKVLDAIKSRDPRQIAGAFKSAQDDIANSAAEAGKAIALAIPGVGMASKQWEAYTEFAQDGAAKTKETTRALIAEGGAASGLTQTLAQLAQAQGIAAETTKLAGEASRKAAEQRRRAAEAARKAADADAALKTKLAGQDAEFMTGLGTQNAADAARAVEIQRQEIAAVQERAAAIEQYRDRVLGVQQELAADPATAALIEQARIRLDLQRQIAEVSERYAMDEQLRQQATAAVTLEANAKIAASQQRLDEQSAQVAAHRTEQAFGVAEAVVQGLGMIEGAERAQAGLQALIETARAIQSFALYDFAAGAKHAVAAAAFAKVALTPKPAAPAGAQQQRQIAEPARGAAVAGTTNIVINGVYATKAQVGAALGAAMQAAKPTGMMPA